MFGHLSCSSLAPPMQPSFITSIIDPWLPMTLLSVSSLVYFLIDTDQCELGEKNKKHKTGSFGNIATQSAIEILPLSKLYKAFLVPTVPAYNTSNLRTKSYPVVKNF